MGIRRIVSVSGVVAIVASCAFAVVSQTSPALADTGCPTGVAASLVSGVYEIDTAAKLQWLKETGVKSNSYKLTANINMSGCTWTNGIGTNGTPFSGTFDGNSKTISNLTLSGTNYLGLFGYLSGTLSDLTLASPSITASSQMIGAIAGELRAGGSVSNVTVTNVSATAPSQFVGGAFGWVKPNSTVTDVSVSGSVSSPGGVAGGIAASLEGSLTNVSSTATVTGSFNIGGLVGSLSTGGIVSNSSSSGTVSATNSAAGGAVGQGGGGTLSGVTTSGTVTAPMYGGGLIGYGNTYFVIRSSSSATVTTTGIGAGGLVGYDNYPGEIRGSFFTGQVQGSEVVGGVGGLLRSVIEDSYSTGTVTATSATNGGRAGGLVGWLTNSGLSGYPGASITNSFAAGLVTPPSGGSSTVGGLVGNYASGTITNSVWDINSTGRSTSGGTAAKGYSTQQLRDYVLYNSDNLNWNITDGISSGNGVTTGTTWSICSGASGGYPFLTRQGLSGTCLPTMAYNGNGSTGGTAPLDGTTPYTSSSTVSVVGNTGALTKTGSVFAGWNTKANGTGTSYAAGDSFTITAPVMLFAQWTSTSSQTISYQSNGGSGSISSQTGSTGSSITLSSGLSFTRTGYTLSRWDTSAAGTGTSYSLGQSITIPAGGLTLWAVWMAASSTTSTTTPSNSSTTTTPSSASTTPTPSSGAGQSSSGGQTTQTTVAKSQPSNTSTTTTTVVSSTTTTTTTVPKQSDAPDVDGVGDSEAGATINGKPVATTVTDENGSIVVTVGEASVRYTVVNAAGIRRSLGAASAAEVQPGDTVTIELKGFAKNADATAWLVPGDTSLGSTTLKDGSGLITGTVPADALSGVRRLVAATQSADDEPIVIAYGVEVANESDSGPSWSLVFLIFLGLAAVGALIIPAARRRRDEEN